MVRVIVLHQRARRWWYDATLCSLSGLACCVGHLNTVSVACCPVLLPSRPALCTIPSCVSCMICCPIMCDVLSHRVPVLCCCMLCYRMLCTVQDNTTVRSKLISVMVLFRTKKQGFKPLCPNIEQQSNRTERSNKPKPPRFQAIASDISPSLSLS